MENSTINVSDTSSRIDARMAISAAVAKMPRSASVEVTASGMRASFKPEGKKSTADRIPQSAQPVPRTHRYPTAERVTQLLAGGVKRNLDRGMGRPQALDTARTWILDEVLAKNEDVKDEDRAARTDQVTNLDVIAFWTAFDAKKPATKVEAPKAEAAPVPAVRIPQSAQPVALTSESLLAAFAGADQVTAGNDLLEISDEPEIPVVKKPAPRKASPKRAPVQKAAPQQEQGLKRLPLSTPGHLDDVVALFVGRNTADGMDNESAVRRACGKLFRILESDKTLSPEDAEGLKRQLRAKLPKRAPTRAPVPAPVPFTVPGQIDREIDLHMERNEKERGMNHDDALRCAVGLVWRQVDEDSSLSTAEREECIQQCQARLPVREQTARAPRGMEFLDRVRPVREPKPCKLTPLQEKIRELEKALIGFGSNRPEIEAKLAEARKTEVEATKERVATKKAERIARAEESARKSRTLGECAMHTIAAPKPKKEKKAKGNRDPRANARAE